jgi:hypothetical protein
MFICATFNEKIIVDIKLWNKPFNLKNNVPSKILKSFENLSIIMPEFIVSKYLHSELIIFVIDL